MEKIRHLWRKYVRHVRPAVLGDGHDCTASRTTCPLCGWQVLGYVDEEHGGGTFWFAPTGTPAPGRKP